MVFKGSVESIKTQKREKARYRKNKQIKHSQTPALCGSKNRDH